MTAAPLTEAPRRGAHEHCVEFYNTEDFLLDTLSDFVAPVLRDGGSAIVVAAAPHRVALEAALDASGIDLAAATAADRYLPLDAPTLLATLTVDGGLHPGRFRDSVGALVERASAGGRRVRIYGEAPAHGWDAGAVRSAIELEHLWNELQTTHDFTLLCAYPMRAFKGDSSEAAFRRICEQHTAVIPGETYSLQDTLDEQQRAVVRLQQEMKTLRADLARLQSEHLVLHNLAHVDALTGLANRRAFDRHLQREWALSARHGNDSFVVIADLDGFKASNDRHGHAAGDDALRQFADALRSAARATDIVGRLGGDEFGVLLINSNATAAGAFAERLREAMLHPSRPRLREIEVSIGEASMLASTSPADALERADLAMFASKRGGRLPVR